MRSARTHGAATSFAGLIFDAPAGLAATRLRIAESGPAAATRLAPRKCGRLANDHGRQDHKIMFTTIVDQHFASVKSARRASR